MTYTAASQQMAIETHWLHFWGAVMSITLKTEPNKITYCRYVLVLMSSKGKG